MFSVSVFVRIPVNQSDSYILEWQLTLTIIID